MPVAPLKIRGGASNTLLPHRAAPGRKKQVTTSHPPKPMTTAPLPPLSDLSTEAAVIATLAAAAKAGHIHEIHDVPVMVLPDGSLRSLEVLRDMPRRPIVRAELATVPDLLRYLEEQTGQEMSPAVFADRDRLRITAFVDYHQPGAGSWLDHSATVQLKLSTAYGTWMNKAGTWMTQAAMAEFLEDNLADIASPSHTDVLDFVSKLEATRRETFKSAINQTTGEVAFVWTKENAGTESARIISEFTLGIPFWQRGEAIAVAARLQHSIKEVDGKATLSFRFKLQNPEQIKDKLWAEMLDALRLGLAEDAVLFEGVPPEIPVPVKL